MVSMTKSMIAVLCLLVVLVHGAWPDVALLADDACPDIEERHARLRISPLRLRHVSACYDIRVSSGSVAVVSVETTDGEPKPRTSVLRYGQGLIKEERRGRHQRLIFGDPTGDDWYQVQLRHAGLTGEVMLHLYRVDITSAAMRGFVAGFGQVMAEEAVNWLLCQLTGCEETDSQIFQEAMVSRGATLAVSTLQGRSLGQMTRDMAMNEAGIAARHLFGGGGGHTMTIIMAIASEVVSSIYAY